MLEISASWFIEVQLNLNRIPENLFIVLWSENSYSNLIFSLL